MQENSLLKNIELEQRKTYTENNATAYNTTGNFLVDLFAIAGSLRSRPDVVNNKLIKALSEDELLTFKLAFYTRDIREGLGERLIGRLMFQILANLRPIEFKKNLKYISEFGRWDDLIFLLGINDLIDNEIINIISNQIEIDTQNLKEGKSISLLAKWLPSINASSKKTREYAHRIIKELNLSNKEYRKLLSTLRAYLNVTEVRLSNKDYDYIKYEEVPSNAMNRYRNAFKRNDKARFDIYLNALEKGETKINATTLYPYDIVEKYLYQESSIDPILENQWKALPNYINGENNFLIMADTSGSMYGRPLATALGLAIYFAERNKGAFKNKFMTFSERPELVNLNENSLYEKMIFSMNTSWMMNTDLQAAFMLILNTALKYKVPKDEMPSSLVIISDMEIDYCISDNWSFYDEMKERFEKAGYKIPNIVFWNVNSRNDTFHVDENRKGVQLASGQSTSVFATIVEGLSPYEYMLNVLNSPRYDCITI